MRDLTDFEKRKIVCARMTGASITKTVELLGFSRAIISRTMSEFEKHGKTSNNRSNSSRPSKKNTKSVSVPIILSNPCILVAFSV